MKPLEPLKGSQTQVFWELLRSLIDSTFTIFLLMATVTLVFIFSVGADILVLWIIKLSFGGAFQQNDLAEKFLDFIKSASAFGTVVAYALSLVFMGYRYIKHLFKKSEESKEEKSESLKPKIQRWLYDTFYSLLMISTVTLIFIALIGIIVLALWVSSSVISTFFLNILKIIASFAIALGYVLTLASSLLQFARDLFKISRET